MHRFSLNDFWVTAGLDQIVFFLHYQNWKYQWKFPTVAEIYAIPWIFDQKRFPPPRVKWEGNRVPSTALSLRAMCLLRRGKIMKNGPFDVPIPSPFAYPAIGFLCGKTRERTQMELERINSVGSQPLVNVMGAKISDMLIFCWADEWFKARCGDDQAEDIVVTLVLGSLTSCPIWVLFCQVYTIELLSPRRPAICLKEM